jgi:hypothetical protein
VNDPPTFAAGDRVTWMREARGGYGYVMPVPAVVVRVNRVRVTIRARLAAGGSKLVSVTPSRLRPRDYPDPIDDERIGASP